MKWTIRKKVWLGVSWGLFFFFLFFEKKYLFTCDKFFPDGYNLWVWRNHPQAEGPFLPSPLRELVPAVTKAGPAQEGSTLGKSRRRIAGSLPASHLSALPSGCRHGEGGRVLADPAAALPPTAICKALEESHKMTFGPASPHQDFESKGNIWSCSALLMMCTSK